MDISVIIINYKTPQYVIDCITSLREKTKGITYEIIVVDNDSGDNSVSVLKETFGNTITLIESDSNLGFGRANNLGAKYATGKYLFLLNSDTLLVNNALKILFDYIEHNEKIGVVGGNLYTRDMSPNNSYSDEFLSADQFKKQARWSSIIYSMISCKVLHKFRSGKARQRLAYKGHYNFTDFPQKVAFIFGTDMMLKKSIFDQVGGFDPRFFMYAEEEELSWRIAKAGYCSVCVPDAKIIHFDGGSFSKADEASRISRYRIRQTGDMTYCLIVLGAEGLRNYYEARMLFFQRRYITLGKLLRNSRLISAGEQEKKLLTEVYEGVLCKHGLARNDVKTT